MVAFTVHDGRLVDERDSSDSGLAEVFCVRGGEILLALDADLPKRLLNRPAEFRAELREALADSESRDQVLLVPHHAVEIWLPWTVIEIR